MEQNDKDLMSAPEYSYLHDSWYRFKLKKMLSKEFEEFVNFFEWAMERGYQIGDIIRRKDLREPASPENCYIPRIKESKDVCVKGGSKNNPCRRCQNATSPSGCTSYRHCNQYRCWLNRSWEDFRKAAKAMGGLR